MHSTRRLVRGLSTSLIYLVLILLCAFMILPFVWMLSTSFKMPDEVFGFPPVLISRKASFINYAYLLEQKKLLLILGNTFVVALSSSLLSLFFCSLGGYGFAKYRFPGPGPAFQLPVGDDGYPGRRHDGAGIHHYAHAEVGGHFSAADHSRRGQRFRHLFHAPVHLVDQRRAHRCGAHGWRGRVQHLLAHHRADHLAGSGQPRPDFLYGLVE